MTEYRLEARNVSKTFGSNKVLDSVDLLLKPGEIHALIGQNGSGKSTVVKILTGYHAPDAGMSLSLDGQPIALPVQWEALKALGVSVVHQDLGLLDHATVAENIGIVEFERTRFLRRVDWSRQREVARDVLGNLQVEVDPETPVADLNAMQRAEVGIARALRGREGGTGVLILDEATRALPREELVRFHEMLGRVVAEGTSVLIVTHNLEEVMTLADRVTVLRDGRAVGEGLRVSDVTEHGLAQLMLGKTVDKVDRQKTDLGDARPVLTVRGLTVAADRVAVDFQVREGEVLGLTGLPGTGHEAIPYAVTGAVRPIAGSMEIDGHALKLPKASVAACQRLGIVLVPERRERDGLAFEMSIRDNIAIPSITQGGKSWFVGRRWQREMAESFIRRLSIKTPGDDSLVKELSGGNQQKVLLAKWLSVRPRVLVLHEPTQAVDVGARQEILSSIREVAESGVAVLLASGEPGDLADVCDRILVFAPDGTCTELATADANVVVDAVYGPSAMTSGGGK